MIEGVRRADLPAVGTLLVSATARSFTRGRGVPLRAFRS
ncbi:hypothetical protein HMPREF0321_0736 [Dermacoccus sp. Ellin185]|nr:hypothetical protein HMPREF0321_0736 [Dermacoccus sp. Ellin185]